MLLFKVVELHTNGFYVYIFNDVICNYTIFIVWQQQYYRYFGISVNIATFYKEYI